MVGDSIHTRMNKLFSKCHFASNTKLGVEFHHSRNNVLKCRKFGEANILLLVTDDTSRLHMPFFRIPAESGEREI